MLRSRPLAPVALAVALLVAFFGAHGSAAPRGIEFRCDVVSFGLIPFEVTHPGETLSDPYCQPQPAVAGEEHDHPRSDPGLAADTPTWLTPLTAMFMHGSVSALLTSMIFLLVFGLPVERRIGPLRLVALFLASGLASAAMLIALAPNLPIVTIGAAGAVSGLAGAQLALSPGARLTPLQLPAWGLFAIWAVAQALLARTDAAQPVAGIGGDIAYIAPVAGLLAGLAGGRSLAARIRTEFVDRPSRLVSR
jgi:membrane associated rhomboid family serine protease